MSPALTIKAGGGENTVKFSHMFQRKKASNPSQRSAVEALEPAERVDAYVSTDNMIFRTDGQPITDAEVPYLQQLGVELRLSKPVGAPADATQEEAIFFAAFERALAEAHKPLSYRCTRMSTKALSVNSSKAYLGKIKLQGRKTWMQYIKRGGNADLLENGTLEQYIDLLHYWVRLC